jgi:16S rRNA G966 N2-methylase RsmD
VLSAKAETGARCGSRPITDRVKESLFSVLYKYALPDGKIVADLFCGVGSLGLEALSRGAEFVTFVERDPKIIAILKKNIEKAGFGGDRINRRERKARRETIRYKNKKLSGLCELGGKKSKVIRADAFRIGAPVDEQKYDLIFVDPPYSASRETGEGSPLSKLLALLGEQSAVDGVVVVRTEKHTELLERYDRLEVIERRQWGTMAVTILQRSSTCACVTCAGTTGAGK